MYRTDLYRVSGMFDSLDDAHLLSSQLDSMAKYLPKQSVGSSAKMPAAFLHSLHNGNPDPTQYDPHDILDQISASLQPPPPRSPHPMNSNFILQPSQALTPSAHAHAHAQHNGQPQQAPPSDGHSAPGGYDSQSPSTSANNVSNYSTSHLLSPSTSSFSTSFAAQGSFNSTPFNNTFATAAAAAALAAAQVGQGETECTPRELEWFAERFKQRRIKLGVTQADVGGALAHLKLPGVGSLSQSTICRFESLTLSHNNMMALKPVLSAWLDEAERANRMKAKDSAFLPNADKKRKRTSIGAAEKRSLEAYFAMQPRPSSDKIAAIAEKLDLSKNVVRVWFCNQRQKKKRMKFSVH